MWTDDAWCVLGTTSREMLQKLRESRVTLPRHTTQARTAVMVILLDLPSKRASEAQGQGSGSAGVELPSLGGLLEEDLGFGGWFRLRFSAF